MANDDYVIGMDVGSTTVKAVLLDGRTKQVLWHDYQRHHTKQPEKVLELLERMIPQFDNGNATFRIGVTGSGAGPLAPVLGGKFVQEVNAVMLAVEEQHPDAQSVVELGGQDAKIIRFQIDPKTGRRNGSTSMNDKCASGTGATIDKCFIKVGAPQEFASQLRFDDSKLHHVAAKCGVFAETDIVNLVKSGIPSEQVLCSLADAIVMQNLSVLTRGSLLKPPVILLGGPNTYLPFLRDCWRLRIPQTWRERDYVAPEGKSPEELIFVPEGAELYAARGAALFTMALDAEQGRFAGLDELRKYLVHGRRARLSEQAGPPLVKHADEAMEFAEAYGIPRFEPPKLEPFSEVRAVIGLDGGSTSSKAVLVTEDGEIIAKAYQLSKGNPIEDTKDLLRSLKEQMERQNVKLDCIGFGATGYAADILEQTLQADVNIVETVAHMKSATHFFGDVDVVCDIGGQDIKVLFVKNGVINNFKLSNSCSAGNGMLLQAMADQFGLPVTDYAKVAFQAELAPKFSYGCAVFLDTDRVNFQKEGFQREELLAGLAQVLPKNVWQYVVQVPRMAALGKKYVLQGGTQYNLAAVKAQVDYIKQRVEGAEVFVHPHTGEAGAIGAAMETLRQVRRRGYSKFVGIDAALALTFEARNDESTQCHFCPNNCHRTFIDAARPDGSTVRYISGFSCEKGTVESEDAMKAIVAKRKALAAEFPNLLDYEGRKAFQHFFEPKPLPEAGTPIDDIQVTRGFFRIKRKAIVRAFQRSTPEASEARCRIRIGIPRVLNIYNVAPFFRTYFEALGIPKTNVMFSDETSEDLWHAGGKYGSVDPCFPSKVVQAHIHHLLFESHQPNKKRPLKFIFFPILTHVPNFIEDTMDNASCPIVSGTPDVMRAAFTKETDFFATRDIEYLTPALSFSEPKFLARRMFECFAERLGITEDESDFACEQGWDALRAFQMDLEEKGRAILETVREENRLAILVIGRPYHADPGLNHGIPNEFQALGYPIVTIRSIPKTREFLDPYYEDELERGIMKSPFELSQIWPENYSANSAQKVWAANFAAHHPNVAVLDLSSFKCGHDAPTYGLIDTVLNTAKTPVMALHDLDANKPGGSIQIRVKTYAYTLSLEQEKLQDGMTAPATEHPDASHTLTRLKANFNAQLKQMSRYSPSEPLNEVEPGPKLVQLRRKPRGQDAAGSERVMAVEAAE